VDIPAASSTRGAFDWRSPQNQVSYMLILSGRLATTVYEGSTEVRT
jgi:hypothetical protein